MKVSKRCLFFIYFFFSGNKYQDLEYLYRIPVCTLSKIIPETCEAIYEALKNDYLKVSWFFFCFPWKTHGPNFQLYTHKLLFNQIR